MREKEFKKLLDREKHIADVKQYFSNQLSTLTDMVNYGTWLIPRAYDSSNKELEDVIVIGVLFKQVVRMTDAVEVLTSNGAVPPAFLQARAAFEASLYIDWILKEEANRKARYYYVSNLRNDRLWALRILEGMPEQQEFTADTQDLASHINFKSPEIQQMAKKQLLEIDRILKQTSFNFINNEFEKFRDKSNREAFWYQFFLKPASLKRIAKDVGRPGEYVFIYERGSKATHIASYKDHVKFSKGGVITFEPIRNLSEIENLLRFTIGIVLHTYRAIITKYRQGELQKFGLKYKNDWRQSFLNIPSVKYKSPKGNSL
jgi:hypothetical protein